MPVGPHMHGDAIKLFDGRIKRVPWWDPVAHITNDVSRKIWIQFKIDFIVIPFLAIRSLQIFAHATTAVLSWHVQKIL